jgi:hypothetical protein
MDATQLVLIAAGERAQDDFGGMRAGRPQADAAWTIGVATTCRGGRVRGVMTAGMLRLGVHDGSMLSDRGPYRMCSHGLFSRDYRAPFSETLG